MLLVLLACSGPSSETAAPDSTPPGGGDATAPADTSGANDSSPPADTSPPGDTAPPEDTAPPYSAPTAYAFSHHIGAQGTGDGELTRPYSVAVHGTTLWVLDTENSRLATFAFDGTWLGNHGGAGTSDGQLATPKGFGIHPDGRVYVADWDNHRMQVFD